MLAGYQSTVATMFPKLRGLTPTAKELEEGRISLEQGKVVDVSDYRVEVFDLHLTKDRKSYASTMRDLIVKAQTGRARIVLNQRECLSRKDGTTGWFAYLEWMEFAGRAEAAAETGEEADDGRRTK